MSIDLADILVEELLDVYENIYFPLGVRTRRFIGVLPNGYQFSFKITPLKMDHIERREFFIFVCRYEKLIGYCYTSPIAIADDDKFNKEGFQICASSQTKDVSVYLDTKVSESKNSFDVIDKRYCSPFPSDLWDPYLRLLNEEISHPDKIIEYHKAWLNLKGSIDYYRRQ